MEFPKIISMVNRMNMAELLHLTIYMVENGKRYTHELSSGKMLSEKFITYTLTFEIRK